MTAAHTPKYHPNTTRQHARETPMTRTHRTAAALTLTAALTLGAAGCGHKDAAPASPSVNPAEAAKADAFKKSEQALRKLERMPANQHVASADYLTPEFLAQINKSTDDVAAHHAKWVGRGHYASITPVQYGTRPRPSTSMRVCVVGDVRLIDSQGRDITVDTNMKPRPKGDTRNFLLYTLDSSDGGSTFRVNGMTLEGKC